MIICRRRYARRKSEAGGVGDGMDMEMEPESKLWFPIGERSILYKSGDKDIDAIPIPF